MDEQLPSISLEADGGSRKRKSLDLGSDDTHEAADLLARDSKKVKLVDSHSVVSASQDNAPVDRSTLPPEIWHRVFIFCPPRTLGNLLCVNKLFNLYLDPSSTVTVENRPSSLSQSVAKVLRPNTIWRDSRRLFWPKIPGPLKNKTDLDMWRLACSLTCQFCGKRDLHKHHPGPDSLHVRPRADGVVCIWPFRVCCCGSCLLDKSIKEMDLLMSDVPTFLMPALPFIFSTPDQEMIPTSAIERGQVPTSSNLTKLFWSPDVESLRQEFLSAKELGAPAVEEWLKGLSTRGQDQRADAAKWEKFADSGGIVKMQTVLYPGYQSKHEALEVEMPAVEGTRNSKAQLSPQAVRLAPPLTAAPSVPKLPDKQPTSGTAPKSCVPSSLPSRVIPLARVERTQSEVSQLKAARKAEVVRRAMLLDPPLAVTVLEQTPAFRAAIQIIAPLDDTAWEILKPRLLVQGAQAVEQLSKSPFSLPQKPGSVTQPIGDKASKTKEDIDAEWDEIQGPVRLNILKYADEVVRDWDDGEKVTKENTSSFAADVLLHVRKRFYTEVEKDAAAARAAGREPVTDPPQGPFTQKLTLENMKYVFDMKVRPLTEPLRKELFLCNGCDFNSKYFGFEGVIQHYAAKHTTALSMGNVVVHWRAEWPVVPPFKPNLRASRHAFHPLPAIPPQPLNHDATSPPTGPRHGYGSFASEPSPAPPLLSLPLPPQPESYPVAVQGRQYSSPFVTQPFQQPPQPPYLSATSYPPIPQGYGQLPYQRPPQPGPYQPFPNPAAGIGYSSMSDAPQSYGTYPASVPPVSDITYASSQPRSDHNNYNAYPNNGQPGNRPDSAQGANPPLTTVAPYSVKIGEMSRRARRLWMTALDVKDVTDVVRTFIVIHNLDKFFQSRFGEPLPFEMFLDGLSNHKKMRPIQKVKGLLCRTCFLDLRKEGPVPKGEMRSYSLPQLLNHVKIKHINGTLAGKPGGPPGFNWMTDMLQVPPPVALRNMAGRKHPLLLEAVQHATKQSVPGRDSPKEPWKQNHQRAAETAQQQSSSLDQHGYFYGAPSAGQQKPQKENISYNGLQTQRPSPDFQNAHGLSKHGRQASIPGKSGSGIFQNKVNAAEDDEIQQEATQTRWAANQMQIPQAQLTSALSGAIPGASNSSGNGGTEPSYGRYPAAQATSRAYTRTQERPVNPPPHRRETVVKAEEQVGRDARSAPQVPRQPEERDLLGALEMHLAHAQEQPTPPPKKDPRPEQRTRVIYVDDHGREVAPREPPIREPERYAPYPSDSHRNTRAESFYGRPQSSGYVRYAEPVYSSRPAPAPASSSHMYAQQPPTRQHEYYGVYADKVRPARPTDYEPYELVRVIHPDGDYYVRRPVRQDSIDNGARYYATAAPDYEEAAVGRTARCEAGPLPPPSYRPSPSGYEVSVYGRQAGEGGSRTGRTDGTYYEEYDPRHPSTATAASAPANGRRPEHYQ